MQLRVLAVGDVVGDCGVEFLIAICLRFASSMRYTSP